MIIGHHRRRPSSRRRQRGATIVETAIVLPIFFTLVFGGIDVGRGVFQTSQATGAAADGARVGVLDHTQADVPGSPAHQAIVEAVEGRLAGQAHDPVVVTCLTSSGDSGSKDAVSCADADPDTDFLRVQVAWRFRPVSFVGSRFPVTDITGTATMLIIRQPTPQAP